MPGLKVLQFGTFVPLVFATTLAQDESKNKMRNLINALIYPEREREHGGAGVLFLAIFLTLMGSTVLFKTQTPAQRPQADIRSDIHAPAQPRTNVNPAAVPPATSAEPCLPASADRPDLPCMPFSEIQKLMQENPDKAAKPAPQPAADPSLETI